MKINFLKYIYRPQIWVRFSFILILFFILPYFILFYYFTLFYFLDLIWVYFVKTKNKGEKFFLKRRRGIIRRRWENFLGSLGETSSRSDDN